MKRRYTLTRSVASVATLLSAGALVGIQVAAAPAASATTISLSSPSTWTGASTAATGNTNWGDSSNWSTQNGDVAPTAGGTFGPVTFPDLPSCDNEFRASGTETPACYSSTNDLAGVTVNTLNIDSAPAIAYPAGGTPSSPGYSFTGSAVTLTGGLKVTGDGMTTMGSTFSIPLTLSGTQAWSMPGSSLDITSDAGGASSAVNVSAAAAPSGTSTNLQLDGHVDTSSFAMTGQDPAQTGSMAGNNGFLELNKADINGSNSTVTGTAGNPVTVTDAAMVGAGSVGSLSVKGGDVNLADVMTYSQAVLTTGGATFDSNSQIDFDLNGVAGSTTVTPGTDYSQLTGSVLGTSTGAISLGGAAITLTNPNAGSAACVDPVPGTVYTLATGTSLSGNVSFSEGGSAVPVPDKSDVSMQNCANTGSDQFRIDYTKTALTATAVEDTTTSLSANPASPQVNQSDVLTASVAAATGTPAGSVTFVENFGGNDIPGCTNVALDANGKATCTTSFSSSGDPGVGAAYTPGSGTNFAASTGGPATPLSVQPIPGASSSTSSTASGSTTSATATNPDNNVTASASGGQGTVTVSNYSGDPAAAPTFNSNGSYFDVQLAQGSTFTSVTISDPNVPAGDSLYWYNPSGGWQKIVGGPGSTQSPFNLVIDSTSSPTISQMTGTIFAVATPVTGYDLFASDGGVFNLGGAVLYGSKGGQHLNAPVVGGAKAKGGNGYYMVASDGGVFNFGPGATYQGSKGGQHLNAPVVGMAVDPATGGYWLVAADGGVFNFNAPFLGSKGGQHLNAPIVGIAATPDGNGYYLVAADGGVFNFGDSATFQGSTGGRHLNAPVVGMAVDASTGGYWLVASDGGIFNFGAPLEGSMGGHHLNAPVVGMAVDASTGGYWLVASDGGIFNFNAPYQGSMGGHHLNQPVVGMAEG